MRKIEVHTDTPTEFELGETAADMQRRREEREQREREGARRAEIPHSIEEGVAEKIARTESSESEMDIVSEREVGISQSQFRCKKEHISNI